MERLTTPLRVKGGWYLHMTFDTDCEAVSGPYTRNDATARSAEVRAHLPVKRVQITQEPSVPEPAHGRRWYASVIRDNGVIGVVGPFHSRKRAVSFVGQLLESGLFERTAEVRVEYAHNELGWPREYTRRGDGASTIDKPESGS